MTLKAYRYKLPLVKPVKLPGKAIWKCDQVLAPGLVGRTISHREGILLYKDGQWAEASPLPGFSRETIGDVITELRAGTRHAPSLRFALSSLEEPHTATSIPINALVPGVDRDELIEHTMRLKEQGCRAVKLKLPYFPQAVDRIHTVRNVLGPDVKIRCDANRRHHYGQTASIMQNIKSANVEYIEEPINEPLRFEELIVNAEHRAKYALDETLAEDLPLDLFPNAAAFVVKPTILGGLERVEELAASGKKLVFSAAYESGVGIAQIARLAVRFSPNVPAGLDTYSWLAKDVLGERLIIEDWQLKVPSELNVRCDLLEEIEL